LPSEEIILCEAVLDALTFCANGVANVSTLYGTEGFTDELAEALKPVRRVKLAYDADEAGDRAAARDAERLRALGVEVWRIKFPWGMDANEYARKVTPAGKSLALLINAAQWMGKGAAEPPRPADPPPPPPPPEASADEPEPWELVPVGIAERLARELGEELKGMAMEIDEDGGEPLPMVSSDSIKNRARLVQKSVLARPVWRSPGATEAAATHGGRTRLAAAVGGACGPARARVLFFFSCFC